MQNRIHNSEKGAVLEWATGPLWVDIELLHHVVVNFIALKTQRELDDILFPTLLMINKIKKKMVCICPGYSSPVIP